MSGKNPKEFVHNTAYSVQLHLTLPVTPFNDKANKDTSLLLQEWKI